MIVFPIAASNSSEEVSVSLVNSIAAGSTLGLEQGLLAAAGQPALTVLAVGYVSSSGKVLGIISLNAIILDVFC